MLLPKFSDDHRHPGYEFYTNTFGGEIFKRLTKTNPDIVLIEPIALDQYGKIIDGAIAIYISSFKRLNNVIHSKRLIFFQ